MPQVSPSLTMTSTVSPDGVRNQDRLLLANDLRDVCPHCKTVLLVDEAEYPELATAVCLAKKDHIVDDFVYASVSPAYLSAMMDTL